MDVYDDIRCIFEENGVDMTSEVQINDIESLQYISIIVELEQKLNIILPDSILVRDNILTINHFVNVVVETYNQNIKEEAMLLK